MASTYAKRVGTEKGRRTTESTPSLIRRDLDIVTRSGPMDDEDAQHRADIDRELRARKNEAAASGKIRLTTQDKKY